MAYARVRAANASEGAPGLRRQKSPGTCGRLGRMRRPSPWKSPWICLACCRSRA